MAQLMAALALLASPSPLPLLQATVLALLALPPRSLLQVLASPPLLP